MYSVQECFLIRGVETGSAPKLAALVALAMTGPVTAIMKPARRRATGTGTTAATGFQYCH